MNCEEARELITALVDDELSRVERASIEAHLKECSACRQEYEQERALKTQVHKLGVSMIAPARLRRKILTYPGMQPDEGGGLFSGWNIGAFRTFSKPAFALAIVLIVLLPMIYFSQPHNQPISLAALEIQSKIARRELALRETTSVTELRDWQIRSVSGKFAPMEYDLARMRMQPVGGLVQDIDGRKMLVTVYSGAGLSVTCFTFVGNENDAPHDAMVVFDPGPKLNFYLFSKGSFNAVLHQEGDVICLLVSQMAARELLDIIRSQSHKV